MKKITKSIFKFLIKIISFNRSNSLFTIISTAKILLISQTTKEITLKNVNN